MRIGIFGGTFDPPHIGHLILASEAVDQLGLDRLLWVLTSDPPHKRDRSVSTILTRLEMVHAAIYGNPMFELSRVDIDRPGPHYAVDTVRLLKEQFLQSEMFYLMGGDSLRDLPTWHKAEIFVNLCDGLGVMHRPIDAANMECYQSGIKMAEDKIHYINAPLLQISSKDIRNRSMKGLSYRYYLPDAVHELILRNKNYL
jgi:nicotinate-nucleotide adenylyltransferase